MSLQLQLQKKEYRNWVKVALGLRYVKDGVQSLCKDVVKQQHRGIIDKTKQQNNLSTVTCGHCSLGDLLPDHGIPKSTHCISGHVKLCKFRQKKCNCLYSKSKKACPNKVCGFIYDMILESHGSTPPAPYWRNTDIKEWSTDLWSIAKCFINASGYDQTSSAEETDCYGLILLMINNKEFLDHIQCDITGTDVFSKVRDHRHKLFHSHTYELDDVEVEAFIDDMIAVLRNVKSLNSRPETMKALKNLEELRENNVAVILESEHEALIKEVQDFSAKQSDDDQNGLVYNQRKFIERLIHELLKVSIHPFDPRSNTTDFRDVYFIPRMATGKDKNEILTIQELLMKDGSSVKSIYVLGEMGSGKSMFCRLLAYFWCLSHSGQSSTDNDEQSYIKEMEKFDFLLYIPLGQTSGKNTIREMLDETYGSQLVKYVLDEEPRTTLIILDGLDEWTPQKTVMSPFQTEGLPIQDLTKNYTVITTSRPWKLEALNIPDNEIQRKVKLMELDESDKKKMIENTVSMLNASSSQTKHPDVCENQIKNIFMSDIKCTAIMFQQLICLSFDGQLDTSKSAVCSDMIKLFFIKNAQKVKHDPCFKEMRSRSENVSLPACLNTFEACKKNANLIEGMSQLAFLAKLNKKTVFDNSSFENFDISDITECCLKLGILSVSEEEKEDLKAGQRSCTRYSFVHGSLNEFLAEMYSSAHEEERVSRPFSKLSDFFRFLLARFYAVFSRFFPV